MNTDFQTLSNYLLSIEISANGMVKILSKVYVHVFPDYEWWEDASGDRKQPPGDINQLSRDRKQAPNDGKKPSNALVFAPFPDSHFSRSLPGYN